MIKQNMRMKLLYLLANAFFVYEVKEAFFMGRRLLIVHTLLFGFSSFDECSVVKTETIDPL